MERNVIWVPWQPPGIEHLRLTETDAGAVADGVVVCLIDGEPFRARYVIHCDRAWRTRDVTVDTLSDGSPVLRLDSDGEGNWTSNGRPLPALDGCVDVDFAATPFTDTLPIRRLGLRPGEPAELTVAYIGVPELSLSSVRQRYTCLAAEANGVRHRYEGLQTGFTAELAVDADGLVLDYPGVWRRVWQN